MSPFEFLILSFAVWRVTYFITGDLGPFDIFLRLRRISSFLDCPYCVSVWVSLAFTAWYFVDLRQAVILWLALSGAAIFLEEARRRIEV